MLLPPELLAVLFLATATNAFPQIEPHTNVTSPPVEPTIPPDPLGIHGPTDTEEHSDDPCWTVSCIPLNFIPELPTATGWEDENNDLMPSDLSPPRQPDQVVTTRRPAILNVRTSTTPTVTQSPSNNNLPGNADDNDKEDGPGQPTGNPGAGNALNDPVLVPSQPAGNSLLDNIVSRLGDAQPEAQAPQPLPPATAAGDNTVVIAQQQATAGPTAPGAANTASPQVTVAAGGSVTLGTATLTLTPGLSTTIGSDTDATFVGITTNTAGQTIITISSSGTAITATVTDALATITLPKTGFEASITDIAGPGGMSTSRAAGAAASTSSRGAAMDSRGGLDWWTGTALGILGLGVVL
ncbi:hypothetical protein BKA66DRAFT_448693 [Pyrenochaeta sp. MPI-SDFR-AT-0127]|nr:hypothetical protein BKA66DRAFT_448693 [Pyrenochaeta sp. MPI-SDFR-AT-0127]